MSRMQIDAAQSIGIAEPLSEIERLKERCEVTSGKVKWGDESLAADWGQAELTDLRNHGAGEMQRFVANANGGSARVI